MDNLSREIRAVVPVADGATITLPCDRADRFSVTLAGTGRTVAMSGDADSQRIELTITQDGTGSRTVTTWPATVAWRNGSAPTLRTAAGAVDVVVLVRVASGSYLGYHDAASGAGGWTAVDASETVKGIAELATQTEVNTGTDDLRVVTPLKLKAATSILTTGKAVALAAGLALP